MNDIAKNGKLRRNMWSGNPVLRTSFRKRHRHINKILKVLAGNHEEILLAGLDRLVIIFFFKDSPLFFDMILHH